MDKTSYSATTTDTSNQSGAPTGGAGVLIIDQAKTPIKDDEFAELYRKHGTILFRNAAKTDEEFAEFTDRFGHNWVPYQLPGRETVIASKVIQTVAVGTHGLGPHSELCHSPIQPAMAWLYCAQQPSAGGQTTLWDGITLAQNLSAEARQLFEGRQLRYCSSMDMDEACFYYDVADAAALQEKINTLDWSSCLKIIGNQLLQDYLVPALPIHKPSGKEVFVNQLILNANFTPGYLNLARFLASNKLLNLFSPMVKAAFDILPGRLSRTGTGEGVTQFPTMEDQSIIPLNIVRQINELIHAYELAVEWQSGDIVVFDNTRFLHGRRSTNNDTRRILTRFGFPRDL